jgi:hypothetical protein
MHRDSEAEQPRRSIELLYVPRRVLQQALHLRIYICMYIYIYIHIYIYIYVCVCI